MQRMRMAGPRPKVLCVSGGTDLKGRLLFLCFVEQRHVLLPSLSRGTEDLSSHGVCLEKVLAAI